LSELKAEDVARYLEENPIFFEEHAELLSRINVPHPHGGQAIPLSDRQVLGLREKTRALEGKLSELIQFGEENDGISDKLHALTLALLEARTPQDIVAALALHLREGFAVPHHAIRAWNLPADSPSALTDLVPQAVRDSVAAMTQPVCGALAIHDASDWFGEVSPHLQAFACIPLRPAVAAAPIGLLVLASEEPKRFYPGMGTLYLERLGQLVGAALLRMQG
jgi:uncharacterized protein YigA (DUF484 family)